MNLDLSVLNPMQYEAVVNTEGPLMIIAGAGSGKTRVITYRIAYLIMEKGVSPWHIFAATFTNKAAQEMKSRVCNILGYEDMPNTYISTFHSLCAMILRNEAEKVGLKRHFTIFDDQDQLSLIKLIIQSQELAENEVDPKLLRYLLNQCKLRMIPFESIEDIALVKNDELYIQILNTYQKKMLENNAVDFGDLLYYVVKLFESDPIVLKHYQDKFKYVLVDEYQDTNNIQFKLVYLLSKEHQNICVVGDEDQSIYSWRGANLSNLFEFQNVYPEAKLIRLEQNYRSTSIILNAASEVIKNNKQRLGKTLWTDNGQGSIIKLIVGLSELFEAREISNEITKLVSTRQCRYNDIAIFYRINALSRVFEDEFRRMKIPYRIIGGTRFYDRKEVKDILAYLKVAANPNDSISLERIINVPARGIGETTVDKIRKYAESNRLSLFEAMNKIPDDADKPLGRASVKIKSLMKMLNKWISDANTKSVRDLTEEIIADTDYYAYLLKESYIEGMDRKENVGELLNAITQFTASNKEATLYDYLENVSLVTAVDDLDEKENSVSLMTVHCAKGLEFPVVFMIGLEHPIFPNQRAIDETESVEEERRLFYVGITRAKEKLYLSRSDSRKYYGKTTWNIPSQFITEIPKELIEEM